MTCLLALDASTSACSAALVRRQTGQEDELLSRYALAPREHTQRLMPMVDELLAEAGIDLSDIDALAYGRGPGSFTGLRIAAGVAQGLAFGLERPLVGVSTLAALALGTHRRHGYRYLIPALDARMGEIYVAAYDCGSGEPIALLEEAVLPPSALSLPPGMDDIEWIGVGSGWTLWEEMPPAVLAGIARHLVEPQPQAEDMALLGLRQFENGEGRPAHQVQPIYLRDRVAWQKNR
ncbi:tRNA (adenosine(37)-N6)-threonylcarbamoyltransferase complex dimerization subunit type 1 TsaB [Pistricoccus aurantiacus]|uniref:tRNA threonylcarbamoyladenosine biosynthesis protein TsaB n=1 Tax=Pistricoccus aurantiacus TaxID=1883414 RepID=A0A5B8SW87_9GAMM|nr:tRNA (adenosine(37)-N6)-threonylcarbamoyltransferase complex dimerization subunit type 1 TsaB [Pistricoccus aurantiacus]QEA39028.1 tRNA (adenosine(37)-N6)-threonylcarbamoyltransferase complex dimerization subunit type 1 TsaB [Pistricoccus aurantiacus]